MIRTRRATFYTEILGLVVKIDASYGGTYRWLDGRLTGGTRRHPAAAGTD